MQNIGYRSKKAGSARSLGGISVQGTGSTRGNENFETSEKIANRTDLIDSDSDRIRLLNTNVRSLIKGSKREELRILIQDCDINIVGITETWGRSDITDTEFDFPDFNMYRKDRSSVNDKKGVEWHFMSKVT